MISDLNAKDLCRIIAQCRESGVSVQMDGLTIALDPNHTPPMVQLDPEKGSGVVDLTKFGDADKIAAQGADQIAIEEGEEFLLNLMVEDPERYEELVAQGVFEEGGDDE